MQQAVVIGALVVSVLQLPATARADAGSLSGVINMGGSGGISDFAFQGPNLDLRIPSHEFTLETETFCFSAPCTVADLGSPLKWRGGFEASGTVNGKNYPTVQREDPVGGLFAAADLDFTVSRPTVLPTGSGLLTAPFTLSGRLSLFPSFGPPASVFAGNVEGRGTARVGFTTEGSGAPILDSFEFVLETRARRLNPRRCFWSGAAPD